MSSITGLISAGGAAGGGASHIITDPQKLQKFVFPNVYLKTDLSSTTYTGVSTFWTALGYDSSMYTAVTTTNDTYITIADITSSTNGGYLWWVISNVVRNGNNDVSTIRITVDGGTPVELSINSTPSGANRMILGSGISAGNAVTNSSSIGGNYFSDYNNIGLDNQVSNYESPSDGAYYGGGRNGYLQDNFAALQTLPFERLYFESSIKVEAKQQTYYAGFQGQNAACRITLI